MLRNWRLLAVVGVLVVLMLSAGPRSTLVRTIALGMVAAGVSLNLFVIFANGGRMPAQTDLVPLEQSDDYQIMNVATRFAYLGDWIPVRDSLISPGDICLYVGLAAALGDRFIGRYLM